MIGKETQQSASSSRSNISLKITIKGGFYSETAFLYALHSFLLFPPKKFPPGYVIELNNREKDELIKNFDRFNKLKHSTVAPHAFTEQGLYMLATILKGDLAISTTIAIIDTFTKLRKLARTIDKVNEDAKEHDILPDKATEGKIQAAMNEVFADNLPLKLRKLTFGVNLGVLKFSIETTRESKE